MEEDSDATGTSIPIFVKRVPTDELPDPAGGSAASRRGGRPKVGGWVGGMVELWCSPAEDGSEGVDPLGATPSY